MKIYCIADARNRVDI